MRVLEKNVVTILSNNKPIRSAVLRGDVTPEKMIDIWKQDLSIRVDWGTVQIEITLQKTITTDKGDINVKGWDK